MGHWCAWLIFWHIIHGYLYNLALVDVRSTGAGIKCLHCMRRSLYLLSDQGTLCQLTSAIFDISYEFVGSTLSNIAKVNIVCYSLNFGNNFGIKQKILKYLKESCCLASDQHFSFKCFPENASVSKIFTKLSGLIQLLPDQGSLRQLTSAIFDISYELDESILSNIAKVLIA